METTIRFRSAKIARIFKISSPVAERGGQVVVKLWPCEMTGGGVF
jgi:hypothetical protein